MLNYITDGLKILTAVIIFFCLNISEVFPLEPSTDWSKPLQKCWEKDNSTAKQLIASDNNKIKPSINLTKKNLFSYLYSYDIIESLNIETGEIIWKNSLQGKILAKPIYDGKKLFLLLENTPSLEKNEATYTLNSFDPDSGVVEWRTEIPADLSPLSLDLYRGQIFLLSKGDNLTKFDANTGKNLDSFIVVKDSPLEIWLQKDKFPSEFLKHLIMLYETESESKNTISVTVTSDNSLTVFEEFNRKILWKRKLGGKISDLRSFGHTLFVSSFDNFVYMFDLLTGKVLLRKRLSGRITEKSSISGEIVATNAVGTNSILLFDLKKRKYINTLLLSDAFIDSFTLCPTHILVTTPERIAGFSPECK